MILIDPELDLSATATTPPGQAAKRPAGSASARIPQALRLPSTRTLARFLADAQQAVRLRGKVTVLLTTDAALRDLNRRFRKKNQPTDVLSFPAAALVEMDEKGDLAISVETALRQSAEQGHSLAVEIKVLILHGLLHLAGYDHETDSGQMRRREQSLRKKLGLPLGLIERALAPALAPSARKPAADKRKAGAILSARSLRVPARKNKAENAHTQSKNHALPRSRRP